MNESPIEAYLGRLFDTVRGRGADGWRLLVETEDHLRCAADELEAGGLDRVAAERAAVERFGTTGEVAAALDASRRASWRLTLARLAGAAWFLATVALVSVGISAPVAAVGTLAWGKSALATDPPNAHYSASRCGYLLEYYPQRDGNCRTASVAHHFTEDLRNRVASGALGVLSAAVLVAARRRRRGFGWLHGLTQLPAPNMVNAVGATGAAIVAIGSIGYGVSAAVAHHPWGAWASVATGIGALPAAVWFARRAWRDVRNDAGPQPAVAFAG